MRNLRLVLTHITFKPCTQETEAGQPEFAATLDYKVSARPARTLSQKQTKSMMISDTYCLVTCDL